MPEIKPRDVQVFPIGAETRVLRSRTWDRLKFEIEYALQKGTTANSYLIEGDKIALFDPPGESFSDIFLKALQDRINLPEIDYIILGHVNANRAKTLTLLLDIIPEVTLVCSNPGAIALRKLIEDRDLNILTIKGEETLDLGQDHHLQFILTPSPRWPDRLATYDPKTQILYTDKLFGAHVCSDQIFDEGWTVYAEDRRYYFDCLMAPHATQVGTALNKFNEYEVKFYAPGHGPLVKYGFTELTNLYQEWVEEQKKKANTVALIYASAYGNTATIAQAIARGITKAGVAVTSLNCEVAEPEEIKAAVEKSAGFIMGSPTLGGHAPTQVQTALGIVLSTADKNKLAGVFGSFGWSGEAIDILEGKFRDAGYRFGFEPIRVKFKPTDAILKYCEEAGTDFAQLLQRQEKKRKSTASGGESESARTEQAVGRIVGSLCVVTAQKGELSSAMLASWVSQASFNPPGLTMAVAKDRAIENLMQTGDRFVLNILPEGNAIQKRFMKNYTPGEDRFEDIEKEDASNGGFILKDALAYVECHVSSRMECGDHWVVYAVTDTGKVLDEKGKTAVHYRKTGSFY
ncbi:MULTISPECIES: diflavin flavoprotein [Spirulina sp. CCY15215]|uniref:diflavin flavoprotein n=1 Tax=Spirulina sp. CCY15215 TaxID=2767591 RepID=UPI001950D4EF|nr:diflavin flavoprotein [Spirulina major]